MRNESDVMEPGSYRGAGDRPAYPDIGDYAVLGDARSAALIGPDGGIDWACFPNFSSRAWFAALLDRRRGGSFRLGAEGARRVRRRYRAGTPVLESIVETASGTARITDAMSALSADDDCMEPETEILRRIEVLDGHVDAFLHVEPRRDYGRSPVRLKDRGRIGWSYADRGHFFLLRTDLNAESNPDAASLSGRTRLFAGDRRHVSLSFVSHDPGVVQPLGECADHRLARTTAWWQGWTADRTWDGPWRDEALHSALALKLLTHSRSGAVVAAATTSLPETEGGSRNWDYRYCWLRDAALTIRAFISVGCMNEAGAFLDWMMHATRKTSPRLRVLYDVYGNARIPERILPHLEGWRGSRPVRVGNDAFSQFQLDAYGQVIVAAAEFVSGGGHLGSHHKRYLKGLGRVVSERWHEPDAGIWEVRGVRRHYTHSKLMCWAALDSLMRMVRDGVLEDDPARLAADCAEIEKFIETECLDPERGYRAAPDLDMADASCLIIPNYGYIDARDPRFQRTFESIDRELGLGRGLLLRYPPGFDGLESHENAFGLCSFWAVEALARMGRRDEAEQRMRALVDHAGELGFYAEEIDRHTGDAMGNYPQAFSHVGLILAAHAICRARQDRQGGRTAP